MSKITEITEIYDAICKRHRDRGQAYYMALKARCYKIHIGRGIAISGVFAAFLRLLWTTLFSMDSQVDIGLVKGYGDNKSIHG